MDVRFCSETRAEAEAWDAYVAASPAATSDHLWGWRRVLLETFGYRPYYLSAVDGGRVVGILPLFRIPRGLGRYALSSIPFGNYGGICADSPAVFTALLDAAKQLLGDLQGEYLDLRHRTPVPNGDLQPQRAYSRFTLPLLGEPALHLQALGSNNRKKLSKARRTGLRLVCSRDMEPLYQIHTHTMRRLGTPCFPRRYFELILEQFSDRAALWFVASGRRFVAYELNLRFKQSLVIQLGGMLWQHAHTYPNYMLFWRAIEEGCAHGVVELDYCRNRTDSGSAHFKRQLHLREEPLVYQYYLPDGQPVPQRHPSNPKYRLAISLWKQLPLRLTRWVGPSLVRYFA